MVDQKTRNNGIDWQAVDDFISAASMPLGFLLIIGIMLFGGGWLTNVVFGKLTTGQYLNRVKIEWPRKVQGAIPKIQNAIMRIADIGTQSQDAQFKMESQNKAHKSSGYREINSPYGYIKAVIESLSYAAEARSNLHANESQENQNMFEQMTNMRFAINKLQHAQSLIEGYTKSSDIRIAKSAHGLVTSFVAVSTLLDQGVSLLERMASVQNEAELASLMNDASRHAAQIDEAWKLLVYSTATTTYALVGKHRLDSNKTALVITQQQKLELLEDLNRNFGDSIKTGVQTGQYATEAAPAGLWQMLSQPWSTDGIPFREKEFASK